MSEPTTSDDDLRDAITELLTRFDVGPGNVVGAWVLAYTTTGITDDGEYGSNWGFVAHAPPPTIIGLCRLVARDIEYASTQEDL